MGIYKSIYTGAEIDEAIGNMAELTAGVITYDNTESGLTAENVQYAIDELQDEIDNIDLTADAVSYDNTTSGLIATDVQGAIDELSAEIADLDLSADNVTYDNSASGLVSSINCDNWLLAKNSRTAATTGRALISWPGVTFSISVMLMRSIAFRCMRSIPTRN